MKPIVELKNLSKTIGRKKIIDNLSLSLYPGRLNEDYTEGITF